MLGQLAALVLVVATQNVRVGMPPYQARHDIRQAAALSSVVLTQEMGYRRAVEFRPAGWRSAHFAGTWPGDCATYWQRSTWRELRSWVRPVSFASFPYGHRWLLATVLRHRRSGQRVAFVCVHLITHGLRRPQVEARSIARVRRQVRQLRATMPVVVGGDWNRPYGQRARFHGCHSLRPGRAGRVDYVWGCGMRAVRTVVLAPTYSDHDGVRARFRVAP